MFQGPCTSSSLIDRRRLLLKDHSTPLIMLFSISGILILLARRRFRNCVDQLFVVFLTRGICVNLLSPFLPFLDYCLDVIATIQSKLPSIPPRLPN